MSHGVGTMLPELPGLDHRSHGAVLPFLVGTMVGGVAGAVVGTLLGGHATHLLAALMHTVERRMGEDERDRLRFELLLQ